MKAKGTILILGAGSDIAKAIARKFAKENYAIQLAGRDSLQLSQLQKDLVSRYHSEVNVVIFDAEDFNSHKPLINSLHPIPNIAIYIAGVMSDQTTAKKNWLLTKRMIDVNYTGAVSIFNHLAQIFQDKKSGYLVGISSVAGDRGRGTNYIYGSTKAAFSAYLSGLRNELFKDNVKVITVKPGFDYTKMTNNIKLPAKLTATPEEVAEKLFRGISNNKSVIYIKPLWRWIMIIIKLLPEYFFMRTKL